MLKHPRTVRVEEDPDLSKAIDGVAADGDPRLIVRDGKTIAVLVSPEHYAATAPTPDIWANYDPARLEEAFDAARGIFDGIDIEQWKRDIHAARGQASAGRPE